jgi:hypothetical protein
MVAWAKINAYGSTVIAASTIVAASYLLITLFKQGRGKLRVRLLIGMVSSDLLLGYVKDPCYPCPGNADQDECRLVAIVPEAKYIAGHPLITGSGGCVSRITSTRAS